MNSSRPAKLIKEDPTQRLVSAAIEQIEKHGLAKLTVRNVAAAAGMNIAAVNYYFRSKDVLVRAALEGTARHLVADSQVFLERMSQDPEPVLVELLSYYIEGSARYPQITKAHMYDAFVLGDYGAPFPTLFAPVVERVRDEIRRAVPGLEPARATNRAVIALSAALFPSIFGGLFRPIGALSSARERLAYAEEIARTALSDAPKQARKRKR